MKRLLALGAVALPAAIILWRIAAPSAETAAEMPSPAARALLDAASMEPVDLALEAGHVFQVPGSVPNWLPGDHRIAFRVPAAAVSLVDLAEGRMGSQRLGFELWSETLDPFRADLVPDRTGCRPSELSPCASAGPDGGRVGARYRAGEYPLAVTVTNIVGVPGRRERILRSDAGVEPISSLERGRPCDVREDPELNMLVARTPEGVSSRQACNFGTGGAVTKGRHYRSRSFLKLAPDGAPEFAVRCGVYVTAQDDAPPELCEMRAYFGVWPLFLRVRSDRAAEWDATFERVRAYLDQHTVARTD